MGLTVSHGIFPTFRLNVLNVKQKKTRQQTSTVDPLQEDNCYKPLTDLQLTLNDQVKTEFIS